MKGLKFFFIGFFLSLPFWLGLNVSQARLEDFFFRQFYYASPPLALARVVQPLPEIEAKSALVVKWDKNGQASVIFAKNPDEKLAIASLTKLMTMVVAAQAFPLDKKVVVSPEAISKEWTRGRLSVGEKIEVGELLKMILVESSNDAAQALSEIPGRASFVEMMNHRARELGLPSTHFATPSGLEDQDNFSTAQDLASLTIFILKKYPDIFAVSSQPSVIIRSENAEVHHRALNTDELISSLGEIQGFRVVGGKTGYTDEAGGCLILVLQNEAGDSFINILLGARDAESRFAEMRKIVTIIKEKQP